MQFDLIENKEDIYLQGLNKTEQKVADKLIENNILLKLDLGRAKELGFAENHTIEIYCLGFLINK